MDFWKPVDYINKLIDIVLVIIGLKKDKNLPSNKQETKEGSNIIILGSVHNLNIGNNSTQENADEKLQEEYEDFVDNVLININEP